MHAACMPASTPYIFRRRRRDADRNNKPWMNMSIVVVLCCFRVTNTMTCIMQW